MNFLQAGFHTTHRRRFTHLLFGLLISGFSSQAMAFPKEHMSIARQLMDKGAHLSFNAKTGKPRFISLPRTRRIQLPGTSAALSAPDNASIVMQNYAAMFGIKNPDQELRSKQQLHFANGRSMVRYQQLHQGIPVLGGELIVNLDEQQRLISINGEISDYRDINPTPGISAEQASNLASQAIADVYQVEPGQLQAGEASLKIFDPRLMTPRSDPAVLVWQLEVGTTSTSHLIREFVLVNAHTGEIALHFNQVHRAKSRRTYDSGGNLNPPIYNNLPGRQICSEADGDNCSNGNNTEADKAHRLAGEIYDFFLNLHGRDGMDGRGGVIQSVVNYCENPKDENGNPIPGACPYIGASWDGEYIRYGNGMITNDIAAHELTHAFTQYTSQLFYYYQSGAINESLSDLWGELFDMSKDQDPSDDWQLGEGSKIDVIRNMANPVEFGDPDHMRSQYYHRTENDDGGVHTNSGINNKAVYLMAEPASKTFSTETTSFSGPGIGTEKVAHIYFEAQTTMLTSASDYADLYEAVNQACSNLLGSHAITADDCTIVKAALDAVQMNLDPNTSPTSVEPLNPDAPLCDSNAPTQASYVVHDNFEHPLAGWWTIQNIIGTGNHWQRDFSTLAGTPYATSGVRTLFGEATAERTDHSAILKVRVPQRSPYLHFNHFYEFEHSGDTYFDGGKLQYSQNNGLTWRDLELLDGVDIQGRDYNGQLAPSDNPNFALRAFVGVSLGYVSSRYNLSSLAGQSVLLRWRISTNSNNDTAPNDFFGWGIDDVSVFSCNNTPPTAPQLIAPANRSQFTRGEPISFEYEGGIDTVDGDEVSHTILVCAGEGCLPVTSYTQFFSQLSPTATALAGLGVGGLLLLGLAVSGRRRQVYLLLGLLATLLLSSSCGGGTSSRSGPPAEEEQEQLIRWRVEAFDGNSVSYSEIRSYTLLPR